MAITLNTEAKDKAIRLKADVAIVEIEQNANKGIAITDIYLPKETFSQIRSLIDKHMNETETKYCWLIMQGYMSLPYGNNRHLKFRLL